ncbi:hypothetical protein A1359_10250 [Methylomonas lenta]|uniref:Tyr recombinase domain-containing protein n=1 Tax=Methylomonas lenta TaxID=980561 RepID=A0A177N9H8_9GAMM|nr:site-specific integrase [Methylomonas lenta]OAI14668.1 hypothetical protein A1359_10250 [Methylomonas lenta]
MRIKISENIINNDSLSTILEGLHSLPCVIRYYDDFDEEIRIISDINDADSIILYCVGRKYKINFTRYDKDVDILIKHLLYFMVSEGMYIPTIKTLLLSIYRVTREDLVEIIDAGPLNIKSLWSVLRARDGWDKHTYQTIKQLLRFLALKNLCGWSPFYLDFISTSLPLPDVDKYASVRTGDVFLSTIEQSRIVQYLDEFVTLLNDETKPISIKSVRDASLLLCSYQYGMRPIQLALLRMRDVRIWNESDNTLCETIHLTFKMVKQKPKSKSRPLTRKIKQDWAPIIRKLYFTLKDSHGNGSTRLFMLDSSNAVGTALIEIATKIVGREVSANNLRHTAAQRLVDSGASHEELAEFLGHYDKRTGQVYFHNSVNQVERVNKALVISEVYRKVIEIHHNGYINKEELSQLKGDQQVAGVPHGIPISGIGGCSSGQPACPFNPVTSCYGCTKFMPMFDIEIHQEVLNNLRGIVRTFYDSSRGEFNSPAYLQLQRTIANVQEIIYQIESKLQC